MRLDWEIVHSMGGAYTTVAIVRMQVSLVSQVCECVCVCVGVGVGGCGCVGGCGSSAYGFSTFCGWSPSRGVCQVSWCMVVF